MSHVTEQSKGLVANEHNVLACLCDNHTVSFVKTRRVSLHG